MLKYYIKYPVLIKALKFINQTNPGNKNTYHNIDRLFTVFKYTTILSEQISIKNEIELFIAALFHDYNHLGKMGNDNLNIEKAKYTVAEFHKLFPEFNLDIVHYLIDCTEYPYTVKDKALTIEGKMIRDADMSYILEDISIVKLYYGLRNEFDQTLETFLDNQTNFLSNVKFYTPYLQNIWNSIKEDKLYEIELLKNK